MNRFAAFLLLLSACANNVPDSPCAEVLPHFATRPVIVHAEEELSDKCMNATVYAVDFWRSRNVSIDFAVVDTFAPEVSGDWVAGVVGVVEQPLEASYDGDVWSAEDPQGETRTALTLLCDVYSAHVTLDECSDLVAAHELGHALGLPHVNAMGNLMHGDAAQAGWDLTPDQLAWAADPFAGQP